MNALLWILILIERLINLFFYRMSILFRAKCYYL